MDDLQTESPRWKPSRSERLAHSDPKSNAFCTFNEDLTGTDGRSLS